MLNAFVLNGYIYQGKYLNFVVQLKLFELGRKMKNRKRTEPDLYVNSRPMTEAESEELSLFIANYKKTHKLIYPKFKKAIKIQKIKKMNAMLAASKDPMYLSDMQEVNKDFDHVAGEL